MKGVIVALAVGVVAAIAVYFILGIDKKAPSGKKVKQEPDKRTNDPEVEDVDISKDQHSPKQTERFIPTRDWKTGGKP